MVYLCHVSRPISIYTCFGVLLRQCNTQWNFHVSLPTHSASCIVARPSHYVCRPGAHLCENRKCRVWNNVCSSHVVLQMGAKEMIPTGWWACPARCGRGSSNRQLWYFIHAEKHQAFRVASSKRVRYANIFKMGAKRPSFATKSCACVVCRMRSVFVSLPSDCIRVSYILFRCRPRCSTTLIGSISNWMEGCIKCMWESERYVQAIYQQNFMLYELLYCKWLLQCVWGLLQLPSVVM